MEHDIKVPRDLVYTGMEDLDDEGLNRSIVKKNPKKVILLLKELTSPIP